MRKRNDGNGVFGEHKWWGRVLCLYQTVHKEVSD